MAIVEVDHTLPLDAPDVHLFETIATHDRTKLEAVEEFVERGGRPHVLDVHVLVIYAPRMKCEARALKASALQHQINVRVGGDSILFI